MLKFLSLKQVAERTGEPYETVKSLAGRRIRDGKGLFPAPDVVIGGDGTDTGGRSSTYGWMGDSVDAWHREYVQSRPHSRQKRDTGAG